TGWIHVRIRALHVAVTRRSMGADSGTFSRGAHPGHSARTQTSPHSGGLGGGTLDSEHRCAVAPVAPVLSQLQNRPSPIPTVVSTRGAARGPHRVGQYAA